MVLNTYIRKLNKKENIFKKGNQIPMRITFKTNEELPATLSATDISKYLGISKANSYQLMNRSDFPTLKLGKRKLVPKDKFLIWVNNNTNVI